MTASYDEDDLQLAVATVGPISVAIHVEDYDFMKYKSGIQKLMNTLHGEFVVLMIKMVIRREECDAYLTHIC